MMMISKNRNMLRKDRWDKILMVQEDQVDLVDQVEVREDTTKEVATHNKWDKETHKSWEWESKLTLTSASASEVSEIPFQRQSVTS